MNNITKINTLSFVITKESNFIQVLVKADNSFKNIFWSPDKGFDMAPTTWLEKEYGLFIKVNNKDEIQLRADGLLIEMNMLIHNVFVMALGLESGLAPNLSI